MYVCKKFWPGDKANCNPSIDRNKTVRNFNACQAFEFQLYFVCILVSGVQMAAGWNLSAQGQKSLINLLMGFMMMCAKNTNNNAMNSAHAQISATKCFSP